MFGTQPEARPQQKHRTHLDIKQGPIRKMCCNHPGKENSYFGLKLHVHVGVSTCIVGLVNGKIQSRVCGMCHCVGSNEVRRHAIKDTMVALIQKWGMNGADVPGRSPHCVHCTSVPGSVKPRQFKYALQP